MKNTTTTTECIKIELDQAPMTSGQRKMIDHLATHLHSIADEYTTRLTGAQIVRKFGFADYTGGCHVAIHNKDAQGRITGERLAMVTATSPDFN